MVASLMPEQVQSPFTNLFCQEASFLLLSPALFFSSVLRSRVLQTIWVSMGLSLKELTQDFVVLVSMIKEIYTAENLVVPAVTVSATPPTTLALVIESACPAGKFFEVGTSSSECTECPEGQHQEREGMTFCTTHGLCLAGEREHQRPRANANRVCSSCPTGTFSTSTNSQECTVCPLDKYQLNTSKWWTNQTKEEGKTRKAEKQA